MDSTSSKRLEELLSHYTSLEEEEQEMDIKDPSISTEVRPDSRRVNVFTADFYTANRREQRAVLANEFGVQKRKVDMAIINEVITEISSKLALRFKTGPDKPNLVRFWTSVDSLLKVSEIDIGDKEETINIELLTADKDLFKFFNEKLGFLNNIKEEEPSEVYLIHKSNTGYFLKTIGTPILEFNENNYMPDIVEKYKEVRQRLTEENPFGRLLILEGNPGTGKTSLVRSLITNNDKGVFVIFPINLLNALDSSDLVSFLAEQNANFGKPLVLILEDADACLLPREQGSMSFISTLLNATDGIMGSCMDIRLVCTTNAQFNKIDPAISREGRLLKHLSVGKLSAERATACLRKLTNDDSVVIEDSATLAEVYAKAYNLSNEAPKEVKKRAMGFN